MNLEQFRIFLFRYANNKTSNEETRLYDDFFESYQQATEKDMPAEDTQALKDKLFLSIERNINTKRRIIQLPAFVKIAASILLLLSIGIGIYRYSTENALVVASTHKGERRDVLLNDGTIVTLNADSKLTYPKAFAANERDVTLEGEAFFKVARNVHKPFIIHTASLQTTVLDTSFNVAAYKGEPAVVTVATGKVKVQANTGNSFVILHPDQQVSELSAGILTVNKVDATDYTAWGKGVIYLKETPLAVLAHKLERKYNVHIRIAASLKDNKCLFNGKLSDDMLTNVLDNLHFMSKLQYSMVNDSTVLINNVSCN